MSFRSRVRDATNTLTEQTLVAVRSIRGQVEANTGQLRKTVTGVFGPASSATTAAGRSAAETAKRIYWDVRYPKSAVRDRQHDIEAQGGLYRELLKNTRATDTIFIGGESLAALLASASISDEIIVAYEAAYPEMSR